MISYAAREVFTRAERDLRDRAGDLIEKVTHDIDPEGEVRCHELVRAVARVLGLDPKKHVADGWYGMVDHSWLWTQPREPLSAPPNILDVYAVGRLPMVQLVCSSPTVPFEFQRGDMRKDIRKSVVADLVRAMG